MVLEEHLTKGAYNSYGYLSNNLRYTDDRCIAKGHNLGSLIEAIDWEVDDRSKGGIIVFSTDVNAVKQSENKIINWVKQKVKTLENRLFYNKKLDKIANDKEEVYAWTIGKYLHGRYKAKDGAVFDENSLSIELLNVSTETLISFAEEVCRQFNQETVLVKDYANDKIMFVNGD